MGGKIDTDQFFFFIQAFEVAPTFTFGNLRFGDGDKSISSEQGIGSRTLVCLELIAIANQCFKEYFSFSGFGKELFPLDAEIVKSTG